MFTNRSGYTDDSIMTMAVAYWLLKDPEHRYETLEEAMVTFSKNCTCPNGDVLHMDLHAMAPEGNLPKSF